MAKQYEDFTGRRFGRLVAYEHVFIRDNRGKNVTHWKCRCDCGNEAVVTARNLRDGRPQSCGCYMRQRVSETSIDDLAGRRFGNLTVIKRVNSIGEIPKYECLCDCGNTTIVFAGNLRMNHTKSCGCLEGRITHGLSKSRLYSEWVSMHQRCYQSTHRSYRWYGAKGIKVCEEWHGEKGLFAFCEWAIANGYKDDLTIDRLDSDKDYSPENCRWIPLSENVSRAAKKMWKERKCEDARSEQTDTRQEIVAH